jgi:lipid-A-disaccharide synthase
MARDRVPVARDPLLLGLFPGSREREVNRIFPAMVGAARRVAESRPDVRFEAAAATEAHAEIMRAMAGDAPIAIHAGGAHELMQRAGVGIVCSGTATLEAACFGLPYALVYKTAWLTYEVGVRLVKVKYLGIVNILAGRSVVREFIQHTASPGALADEALRLLNDEVARERLAEDLAAVVATLNGERAADRAALAVLGELRKVSA